ncbi:hypothetical protein [Mariniradius sediminis]|uniref:Lipoprotein n=1 Tax=Mariniradius sediminis TaxID=2909237 RepID=A0ABS9BX16_9BACT|nr:hypothetical protein [Mariniradius sediminis]MCF1752176.1 hypothetical protein [Mariniradius sediminis]
MKKRIGVYILLVFVLLGSCMNETNDDGLPGGPSDYVVLLAIDEDSIDNGSAPNNFSETDVNDQIAAVGLRQQLKFFAENKGKTITLYTGEVGDEGWFALNTIPNKWINAGPTDNGARNYLTPGPGLGAPNIDDDREVLLDEIQNVTPLRATGLKMLVGYKILAMVYDSDISINYSPLEGNMQGANLGMVAFEILSVSERTDGSDGSLPAVSIKILSVTELSNFGLALFSNVPIPQSSSEPFDVVPTTSVVSPVFTLAN